MPPEGLSASVKALDLATGRAREILVDPELIMKPLDEWPEETAQATIMADEEEALAIAVDMWRRKSSGWLKSMRESTAATAD